jgi:hypothetical protein
MKVDVVIAWVDGNDPAHKQKIAPFLPADKMRRDDINGTTRYNSEGEIFYCVASILRFVPFVRKIFIISDNQKPANLDEFIANNFPENQIPIEFVDHKVIFRDYENILPVFNSLSIETCLFRIPDLSENFVYLNDDFFLIRPVSYSDWFDKESVVATGSCRSILLDSLLRFIKPKKNGYKPFGFKDSMLNAAQVLGVRSRYFHIEHTPLPLKKSVLENYFDANPDILLKNINHKFRHRTQFNPQALFYLLMHQSGKIIKQSAKRLLYLKPGNRGNKYVNKKIRFFDTRPEIIYCCIGSLDQATESNRKTLTEWLQKTILNRK